MDAWILVAAALQGRQRQRQVYVLKSRGMAHSDEVRNFRFTSHGIEIESTRGTDIAAPERKPRRAAAGRGK
jgi:circadian clock protein KaiC